MPAPCNDPTAREPTGDHASRAPAERTTGVGIFITVKRGFHSAGDTWVNVRFRDFPIGAVAAEMCRQRSQTVDLLRWQLWLCAPARSTPFRCEIGGRHE
jgi:hypothetical protein